MSVFRRPSDDGGNIEARLKALRWRCALSGRRDALPTAMASLDADQLGRMDEPRMSARDPMDRKYSEAEYKTLLYSQGDRIAASLKTSSVFQILRISPQ